MGALTANTPILGSVKWSMACLLLGSVFKGQLVFALPVGTQGETCPCREEQVTCQKAFDSSQADASYAGATIPCRTSRCPKYVCDDSGSLQCISVKLNYSLQKIDFQKCRKKMEYGRTFLRPMEIAERNLRKKPATFDFTFAGARACWAFHGTVHKLDTDDAHDVVTLAGLKVGNCEPIKIKCVDTTARFRFNAGRQPGPTLLAYFKSSDGVLHGPGVNMKPLNALSRRVTIAKHDLKLVAMDFRAPRMVQAGFSPNIASASVSNKIFDKYPLWRREFSRNGGGLVAKPLVVDAPFRTNDMALFVLTPPYCEPPYY